MRLGDLLYDAGPGLRLDTPFGLIRVDFGYQLRPLDGLRIDGQPQNSAGGSTSASVRRFEIRA